jgi:hypothetical protein
MQTLLLSIGAVAAAVGVFTIGFGFEIYDFSFGNTLIIAGTISLIGGIITIGIAVAVRELTRVADAVAVRPPSRGVPQADSADAVGNGANPRRSSSNRVMSSSKGHSETASRDTRAMEPRLNAVRSGADFDETAVPRARQNVYPLVRPVTEPISTGQPDNVALSPHTPVRGGSPSRAAFALGSRVNDERPTKLKASTQSAGVQSTSVESARVIATAESGQIDRARTNSFDNVWPTDARHAQFVNEAVARELNPEPATAEPAEEVSASTLGRAVLTSPGEPPAASILKSGVINGMAYTLYVDGSIEAQLSQTTMRFNSIDELCQHLENDE